MDKDLLNILSNSNKDIDNQKLMDYLAGKLSDEDKHEVEAWMVDNEFANEAMEGLEQMAGKKNIQPYVDQLNKELHQYIAKKKKRREKRRLDFNSQWVYVAIVFILLILILTYIVIKRTGQ